MPNLIETYARATGLKIDKPWIKQSFWPIPLDKYITLSAGSGQAAKNFSHWQIVIDMLNPVLGQLGISIVQLGDDKTALFSGTYDLRGKMNIAQSAYVIKNAVLHMGVDSWSAHASGALGQKLVALYGTTDKVLHGPHWKGPDTILLESHRNGHICSFGAEGHPKSIDLIRPEEVANAVIKLLGAAPSVSQNTKYIGLNYQQTIIEVVPNIVPNLTGAPDVPLIVRMDYEFNETGLLAILQAGRKIHVFTKAPINLNLLNQYRGQLLSYNHEVLPDCPPEYLAAIARIIPQRSFFSRAESDADLAALRFRFFDVCQIDHLTHRTKERLVKDIAAYLNKSSQEIELELDTTIKSGILRFKTNKYLLSKDKIYLSYAHLLADISTSAIGHNDSLVLDTDEFWRETNHHMIYA